MSVCLVLCVCRGSKYSEVVPDWLILSSDLYGTIHDCGPLQTQFDDVVVLAVVFSQYWFPNIWHFEGYSTDMMLILFWVDGLLDGSCFPVFLKVQYFLMFPVKVMIVFPAVLCSVT